MYGLQARVTGVDEAAGKCWLNRSTNLSHRSVTCKTAYSKSLWVSFSILLAAYYVEVQSHETSFTFQTYSSHFMVAFSARDSIICLARYMLSPERLSVCLSHGRISQSELLLLTISVISHIVD